MNSKQRLERTFRGEPVDQVPVAPHWWGVYKFELAGVFDRDGRPMAHGADPFPSLAEIDAGFFDTFLPDWFHLGAGTSTVPSSPEHECLHARLLTAVRRADSDQAIDDYVALCRCAPDAIRESGVYDHVRIIVERYGDTAFVAMNEGNPVCDILGPGGTIGFEEGLVAVAREPERVARLAMGMYDAMLGRMRVLAEYGCHAYIGSETYASADIISPDAYRAIFFPAQQHFYRDVRRLGMEPIVYFLGDVNPLIPDINRLGVTALMVEESKKTFVLDVLDLRKRLAPDITLFGNLDSVHCLLRGTREDVVSETLRQLEAARVGRFVMANGSPITHATPRENLKAMIETVRHWRAR
jgi:hypothetical protein